MKSYPMSIQWWYYDECNVTMKSYRLYNDDTMMNVM